MEEYLKQFIREIPDFPRPGIRFKDIAPLLQDGEAFARSIDELARIVETDALQPDICAGPEARGFMFGAALGYRLRRGFVPIRKPGKLPAETHHVEYELEYGTDRIEMHRDAIGDGHRVLIVDDLLATGGTLRACVDLVERCGGVVAGILCVVELGFLDGRKLLGDRPVRSLITY